VPTRELSVVVVVPPPPVMDGRPKHPLRLTIRVRMTAAMAAGRMVFIWAQ